jgi:acetyl-CoA/propionyl-CoA carboxylase biotin carboxyl carrier protein
MVAKLIVWDLDRELATKRMLRALGEYEVEGLTTLIPFHRALLASDQWARAETCRDLVEDREWLAAIEAPAAAAPAEEGIEPSAAEYKVEVSGRLFEVRVISDQGPSKPAAAPKRARRERRASAAGGAASSSLLSPLQGTVLRVAVEQGASVAEGDLICVIEAMKMENEITAHRAGKVATLNISQGAAVSSGEVIATIE